jgi:hypothetical protein
MGNSSVTRHSNIMDGPPGFRLHSKWGYVSVLEGGGHICDLVLNTNSAVHDDKNTIFAVCSPMKIRAKETSPVVYTCGSSVLQELRRTKAALGGS